MDADVRARHGPGGSKGLGAAVHPPPPPLPPRCRGEHVLVRPLLDEKYVAVPNEVSWARMGIETREKRAVEREWAGCSGGGRGEGRVLEEEAR